MTAWDDTDYSASAGSYATVRREDPVIRAQIEHALGPSRTVVNIGAGTGSYEPSDRHTIAVEPSPDMRARRPAHVPPALDASADSLPFDDRAFDAALAVLTIHHWPDLERGLREAERVTRDRIVIMTADPAALRSLWITEYSPEFHAVESRRYPSLDRITAALSWPVEVRVLSIPAGCADGFADVFFGRPESMLDPDVRHAQSAWSFVPEPAQQRFVERLSADLASGAWDDRFGRLRTQPVFEGSMRLLVATRERHTAP